MKGPLGRDCLSVEATVVGAHASGVVEVEVRRAAGCKGCAGLCFWRRLSESGRERCRSDAAFEVGDEVSLTLPARSLLRGSLLLYGLPLAALLAGALAGQWLARSDGGALLGAVVAVLALLAAGPALRRRIERSTLEHIRVEPRR
ncbi:MAG TPA: SoxR reducing system RseC family protein [Gammaproteobacteria bacterium]|nr:SoxR reducing system RseC family protein [Gammaproteobacteria bacterium]